MKTKRICWAIVLLSCSFSLFAVENSISYPASVLNLSNWKITLPIDVDANGSPDEIKQPALATYSHAEYFHLNTNADGVVFKAHCGGVTTDNSGYPRCELREMKNNGVDMANWASNDGDYHILEVAEKITHLPVEKKHVVVAQIHDTSDDIVMLRLETNKLFLEFNGSDGPAATTNYVLGTEFTFKIVVHNGVMEFYYNGNLFHTETQTFSGAYFKVGMYTQSSCQGEKQVTNESCDAYGEMELLGLSIYHGASLPTTITTNKIEEMPTPSIQQNKLFIQQKAGDAQVSIMDTSGKMLFNKTLTFSGEKDIFPLNIDFTKGMYIITVSQNKQNSSYKILVD
jgi:hypothetical protein